MKNEKYYFVCINKGILTNLNTGIITHNVISDNGIISLMKEISELKSEINKIMEDVNSPDVYYNISFIKEITKEEYDEMSSQEYLFRISQFKYMEIDHMKKFAESKKNQSNRPLLDKEEIDEFKHKVDKTKSVVGKIVDKMLGD